MSAGRSAVQVNKEMSTENNQSMKILFLKCTADLSSVTQKSFVFL